MSSFASSLSSSSSSSATMNQIRLFLAGDFMPGRGVDAVMPVPCPRELREGFCKDAFDYARLAEQKQKRRFADTKKVSARDVLGEVAKVIESYEPHVRMINLETSVTKNSSFYPHKGINYRASEENMFALLDVLKPDIVSLANNHAMDFSREGMEDTLKFFDSIDNKSRSDNASLLRVKRIGAGWNIADAMWKTSTRTDSRRRGTISEASTSRRLGCASKTAACLESGSRRNDQWAYFWRRRMTKCRSAC